jgi:hypothetical protein
MHLRRKPMNDRLGHTFRDKITGFTGVATGHAEYLTGCNQTLLSPRSSDPSKRAEAEWFDNQRLEMDTSFPLIVLDNGDTPGCDREAPKR